MCQLVCIDLHLLLELTMFTAQQAMLNKMLHAAKHCSVDKKKGERKRNARRNKQVKTALLDIQVSHGFAEMHRLETRQDSSHTLQSVVVTVLGTGLDPLCPA